ncbi:MAG: Rab family GTPase, partial [Promethearchaeota archaeon]
TIGCQFHTQVLERRGYKINLVLWDFSGQKRFRFFFGEYMRGAAGAFVMFDLSQISTLNSVGDWLNLIKKNSPPGIPILLIGGKYDLVPKDKVDETNKLGQETAKKYGFLSYTPTSSKLNFNVNESILYMVDLLLHQAAQRGEL